MKLTSITAISSGLLLAMFTLQGAQAQTRPAREVTRDELRACMNSESQLATRSQAVEARAKGNRDEGDAIRAEAQQLADEQKRIVADNGPMDRFNRKVKAHNARVQVARTEADSVRGELEATNKALIAYNEQCGGISYRVEDKEAILKEREPAKN